MRQSGNGGKTKTGHLGQQRICCNRTRCWCISIRINLSYSHAMHHQMAWERYCRTKCHIDRSDRSRTHRRVCHPQSEITPSWTKKDWVWYLWLPNYINICMEWPLCWSPIIVHWSVCSTSRDRYRRKRRVVVNDGLWHWQVMTTSFVIAAVRPMKTATPLPTESTKTPAPAEYVQLIQMLDDSPITSGHIRNWTQRDSVFKDTFWLVCWKATKQRNNSTEYAKG